MIPYQELIRTEEFWEETLENFSWFSSIASKSDIKKEIKVLVTKIMEIKKPYAKQPEQKEINPFS